MTGPRAGLRVPLRAGTRSSLTTADGIGRAGGNAITQGTLRDRVLRVPASDSVAPVAGPAVPAGSPAPAAAPAASSRVCVTLWGCAPGRQPTSGSRQDPAAGPARPRSARTPRTSWVAPVPEPR